MKQGTGLAGFAAPAARTVAWIAATVIVGYACGAAIRYGLIEREDLGLSASRRVRRGGATCACS